MVCVMYGEGVVRCGEGRFPCAPPQLTNMWDTSSRPWLDQAEVPLRPLG